ncbi:UPF0415 protein C7orf25 homolog [Actinia tenebrosa]|uniref:UPF0415 protein C7orf25 homolog n=1 Tax=Actinia tenebrosa TaxID=6105 RepID=A0A6P8HKQ7_ACTTE|nr:UPF0415 protein C7orf25 homolog [Actinia tenebrosa]XP_031555486.1 UPF0415 protein C7orf25 homolog [Actinia tenebrosa]XP_031555487.1 UPF0415 protein C7orf25 homolog [Actinia tenebrosa]XP_031555488.1 UPF0415 protein C7orf25 homolog [Actinia tenebrosa]
MTRTMTEEKVLLDKLQELQNLAAFLLQRSEKLNPCIEGLHKLTRKIKAELKFLESLQTKQVPIKASHIQSTNLTHLQGVVKATEQSNGVVAVLRTFNFSPSKDSEQQVNTSCIVDVIANNGSNWIKVIARNPKSLHKIWEGQGQFGDKDLFDQAKVFVECSKDHPVHFQNPVVTFLFCNGVTESLAKCLIELGIDVQGDVLVDPVNEAVSLRPEAVSSSCMQLDSNAESKIPITINRVNLDVSTMIAFVSAVTNGGAMFVFKDSILNSQAEKERRGPLLPLLIEYFEGKELLVCSSAINDFEKIVQTIGGPKEKERASQLMDQIRNVPDQPSKRSMGLKDSASIKLRSKIVFGTGDTLKAVTVTANSSFVRAASSQGVNFSVFLHDSRALTESKESQAVPIPSS